MLKVNTFINFYLYPLAIFFISILFLWASDGFTIEIRVCAHCEFTLIHKAIEKAPPGAIIRVAKGHYKEPTLIIKNTISLIGEDFPILDGQNQQQILVIFKSDHVKIEGFEFRDTGVSFTSELAALRVIESSHCEISNNRFYNSTYGIYLEKSHQCHILNNKLFGQAKDESSGGNGIHIWTGSDHKIEKNHITGHRDGIYLEFVKNSFINSNTVYNNLRYGLHFMFSNNTHSVKNIFSDNGSGVAIMYSQKIIMNSNRYLRNRGTAAYGLLFKDIQDSQILNNEFKDNTVAIYMEGSNRSQFEGNDINLNGYGLKIMGNCENNIFKKNSFRSNSFDITTNSSMSWNNFDGNYWTKYKGYDLDFNNIGDVPFRPVSLSSVVVETLDSSFYLIGSLLFELLNFIENALPELTPENLKDQAPLMTPLSQVIFKKVI